MKRAMRWLLPIFWTGFFVILTLFIAAYVVEGVYEVPIRAGSVRLERPAALWLLPAALLVLIARGWLQRDSAPRLRVSRGLDLARVSGGPRLWLRDSVTGMRVAAVVLVVLGLTGPQSIHARDTAEVEGIDIMLTLDMSLSMQAADIEPNRFAATTQVVDDFIMRRPNDRIGGVVFGRDAYTLLPLTTDKSALRTMIRELTLGMVDGRGTAIGNALGTSLNRLRKSKAKSKVVILLTDGESNSGNVSPDQAAEFAQTMGVKVYTILMGQSDQAKVQRGVDLFGRPIFDHGDFPVNPELLRTMATRTGGAYFQVTDRQGLIRSFHEILDRLEKSQIEDAGRVFGELFPALIWPALVLLVLELLMASLFLRRWP